MVQLMIKMFAEILIWFVPVFLLVYSLPYIKRVIYWGIYQLVRFFGTEEQANRIGEVLLYGH